MPLRPPPCLPVSFPQCDSVVNRTMGTNLYCGIARSFAGELEAVHLRHVDVGEEQVQFLALQFGQGVQSVHGFDHLIAAAPQHDAHHLTEAGRVVHRHNCFHKPSRVPINSRRSPQRSMALTKASDGFSKDKRWLSCCNEYSSWRMQVSMSSRSPVSTQDRHVVFQSFRHPQRKLLCAWRIVTAPSSFRI